MTTAGRHVIVADEGRPHGRTALATVRALGRAGYAPVVTVGPRPTLAQASRWCAGVLPVPDDVEGWTTAVTEAAARLDALLVMPAGDAAVVALGLPGADLVDKRVVRARALDAGLRVPEEQSYDGREALLAAAGTLPFPVVVKPKRRTSLVPFEAMRADGPGDLERVPAGEPVVVQTFLGGGLTAFAGVVA
ncbi:MAG: hypothetical protein HOQ22_13980, partial [Nocardioidaceae bacterium]|nr:hypothetical protein [Nocardioidaceae bacterium]